MAATPYEISSGSEPRERRSRFSLARLRAAAYGGGFGLLVIAIGLLLIGLGWNGMAGSGGEVNGVPNLNAQLPWLVSGGILGLSLVVFGSSMIVVHNARTDRARVEAKLDEVVTALARSSAAPVQSAPAEGNVRTVANAGADAGGGTFVAGSSTYHRPGCRLVQGRNDLPFISAAEAASGRLRACRVCKPAA
jgi:hypothetical protein